MPLPYSGGGGGAGSGRRSGFQRGTRSWRTQGQRTIRWSPGSSPSDALPIITVCTAPFDGVGTHVRYALPWEGCTYTCVYAYTSCMSTCGAQCLQYTDYTQVNVYVHSVYKLYRVYRLYSGKRVCAQYPQAMRSVYKLCTVSACIQGVYRLYVYARICVYFAYTYTRTRVYASRCVYVDICALRWGGGYAEELGARPVVAGVRLRGCGAGVWGGCGGRGSGGWCCASQVEDIRKKLQVDTLPGFEAFSAAVHRVYSNIDQLGEAVLFTGSKQVCGAAVQGAAGRVEGLCRGRGEPRGAS